MRNLLTLEAQDETKMELSLNVYHNLTSLETANAGNATSKKRYKDNLQMKGKKKQVITYEFRFSASLFKLPDEQSTF